MDVHWSHAVPREPGADHGGPLCGVDAAIEVEVHPNYCKLQDLIAFDFETSGFYVNDCKLPDIWIVDDLGHTLTLGSRCGSGRIQKSVS
jgi:hypothetical protein